MALNAVQRQKGFIEEEQEDSMPKTERKTVGKGVKFERIRRITGYLVGSIDRFCDAKRAEVRDRVKHA